MSRGISKRKLLHILAALLVIDVALMSVLLFGWTKREVLAYPELSEITSLPQDAASLSAYFKKLSEEKGGEYAYEVLRLMPTTPSVDTHLLAHVVGEELYGKRGVEAITACTDDFRNACSHAVVIGALLEYGTSTLSTMAELCSRAPGGAGAYGQCFHGLGHGVLAYVNYELPAAIELCKTVGTTERGSKEYLECAGGVVMEMVGGAHDPGTRFEKEKEYFKEDDPLYPCSGDLIPHEAKPMCYVYLTPHLLRTATFYPTMPVKDAFAVGMQFCENLEESAERASCYSGFGKEFPLLLGKRDIRTVDTLPDKDLKAVHTMCDRALTPLGAHACAKAVVASLFWGGQNSGAGAIRYCSLMKTGDDRTTCFAGLIGNIKKYGATTAVRQKLCSELPRDVRERCLDELSISGE